MTATAQEQIQLPRENAYGSVGRLRWIELWLRPGDRIVDLGCGTGYMVTLPLLTRGHDVTGVDVDAGSIAYGRDVFARAGLDPARLMVGHLEDVDGPLDALIVSEVLEHLPTEAVDGLLRQAHAKLRPGGRLMVTVPNGHGWFEAEAAVWKRLGIDGVLRRPRLNRLVYGVRHRVLRGYVDATHPSTLSSTPHLQRFSLASILRHIEAAGFRVLDHRGSVLMAGPFSHFALTGVVPFMRWNGEMGRRGSRVVAGFYVVAERVD